MKDTGKETSQVNGVLTDEYIKSHAFWINCKYFQECYAIESWRIQGASIGIIIILISIILVLCLGATTSAQQSLSQLSPPTSIASSIPSTPKSSPAAKRRISERDDVDAAVLKWIG